MEALYTLNSPPVVSFNEVARGDGVCGFESSEVEEYSLMGSRFRFRV